LPGWQGILSGRNLPAIEETDAYRAAFADFDPKAVAASPIQGRYN
jgi:3-methyladenine DNA glycosylase Tag